MRKLLTFLIALAGIAFGAMSIGIAHTDGIYNPGANSVNDTQGIDNPKPSGVAAAFYVKGGNHGNATGSASNSFSSAIGTATATRVILLGTWQQNSTALSSVTVNGVSATPVLAHASDAGFQFWTIIGASPGSGTQTVVLNGVAFNAQTAQIWYMDNLNSTTLKHSAQGASQNSPHTTSINITSGDFLFAMTATFGNAVYTGSTDAPANSSNLDTANPALYKTKADCTR
jgi:hypothetical protein